MANYTLPEVVKKVSIPELQGTEKQVGWAKTIREEIMRNLYGSLRTDSKGREVNVLGYMGSHEKMTEWIEQGRNDEHKLRRYEIVVYMAGCLQRYMDIASIADAQYWIDNRTNQHENYMNNKLTKEVKGL